jgi:asparagine synthase (glutamine-hydrolysing)
MCGIIGYFAKGEQTPSRTNFEAGVNALTHRGPDQSGIWHDSHVGLGFRRLSIIDLQAGNQPMSNESKTLHLVFNGEIYNFKELRARLQEKGHQFKTNSDTEVILRSYEDEGDACILRFRGMFALAIYDTRSRSLFLARDRFGKKPLVYCETATGFYFASEIGALLKFADCSRQVDVSAIDAYLELRYIPEIRTSWAEIKRLPAATKLHVKAGKAQAPSNYWQLSWTDKKPAHQSEKNVIEQFRSLFEESVKLRLISDVPLGAFLSGGVDSSVTVAAMTRLGGEVKTFCLGFEEHRFDESKYAEEIAQRLGTQHLTLRGALQSIESIDSLMAALGEPFADQSLLPTFLLSKLTREHVTVALTGDGGDELFGGYKRYRHMANAQLLQSLHLSLPWKGLSKAAFKIEQLVNSSRRSVQWPRSAIDRIMDLDPIDQYLELIGCWDAKSRRSLWRSKPSEDLAREWIQQSYSTHASLPEITRWQAIDTQTYLVSDILRKVDLASMACSLECRCPLLDHPLAEFTASLPKKYRTQRNGPTKALLKELYPDLLPKKLFEREKKGFSLPLAKWMRHEWKPIIQASIEDPWSSGMERCFDRKILRQIWQEHQEKRENHSERLWTWFVLSRWDHQFKPNW